MLLCKHFPWKTDIIHATCKHKLGELRPLLGPNHLGGPNLSLETSQWQIHLDMWHHIPYMYLFWTLDGIEQMFKSRAMQEMEVAMEKGTDIGKRMLSEWQA